MTEFLVILGVVFVGFVVYCFSGDIKAAQLKGKSMEGKAEALLKRDLSSKYACYTFYQNHNYDKAYSQSEWKALYETTQKVIQKVDKESEMYAALLAPFINAIVVQETGYYARRGMQDREHSLEKFMPGVNDRVLLNYYVEPYKYVKDEQRAAESVQAEQEAKQERAQRAAVAQEEAKYKLTQAEKKEIERAEEKYKRAVRHASYFSDNDFYKQDEKTAYAEYMRVLAKYAGKK